MTVVVVGGYAALQAFHGHGEDARPSRVDYRSSVQFAQRQGIDVVYPGSLPSDWTPTSVELIPNDRPSWGIGILTADGRYAGIRQEDSSLDDLLHTYVDENPTQGAPLDVTGSVAPHWESWSDAGGDHAYSAQVGGDEVLVYGSASVEDLRRLLGSLTTERLSGTPASR